MPDLAPVVAGVHAAVHELVDLIDRMRDLLAGRGQGAEVPTSRQAPGSRPPWDGRVANVYMSVHAWAREAEADLGTYVHGTYWRRAIGGDRGTKDALGNVALYCDDNRVPEAEVVRVARNLGTLLRAAQSLPGIDLAPPPALALRQPCPICGEGALLAGDNHEITCANEVCTDPITGQRPSWTKDRWPALLARLTRGTL